METSDVAQKPLQMRKSEVDRTFCVTNSEDAFKEYDKALEAYLSYKGPLIHHLSEAMKHDPDFVLPRVLYVTLFSFGNVDEHSELIRPHIEVLKNLLGKSSGREKVLIESALFLSKGQLVLACVGLEHLVHEQCNDMLAVKILGDIYFFMGESERNMMLVSEERWKKLLADDASPCLVTCYGYAMGALAFGSLETGDLERGNECAEKALKINEGDIWSIHAKSHYFEMTQKFSEAIEWTMGRQQSWHVQNGSLVIHMWWHVALFHLGAGEVDKAIQIYVSHIKGTPNALAMDLADASSLLWRLELRGRSVEQAWWDEVASQWLKVLNVTSPLSKNVYPFNMAHLTLGLSKSSSPDHAEIFSRLLKELSRFVEDSDALPLKDQSEIHRVSATTEQVCLGVQAFAERNFKSAYDLLKLMKRRMRSMGGSTPQRAIFSMIGEEAKKRL